MIEYETGIPLPKRRYGGGRKSKYPLGEMPVGASFFVPNKRPSQLGGLFHHYAKYGKKYTSRTVTENGVKGSRVWRVE